MKKNIINIYFSKDDKYLVTDGIIVLFYFTLNFFCSISYSISCEAVAVGGI